MAAPMGHGRRNAGPRPKVKNPGKTFKRLLGLILKNYKVHLIIVFVCIIISVFSSVQGTLFIRNLIDDYIVPMLSQPTPDFTPLILAIMRVAAFYLVGDLRVFEDNDLRHTGHYARSALRYLQAHGEPSDQVF